MTTTTIEALANRGTIATGDFNLKAMLRHVVLPAFLEDVGDVAWRRKYAVLSVAASTQVYSLPDDFQKMRKVFYPIAGSTRLSNDEGLRYIGDDPYLVAQAEVNTTPGTPGGYYIVQRSGEGIVASWQALKLDCIPDASAAVPYCYAPFIPFANDDDEVDLAAYLPVQFHAGLVNGLRAEIMKDRYGQGDPNFTAEMRERDNWVERAKAQKELGPRGTFASFMR